MADKLSLELVSPEKFLTSEVDNVSAFGVCGAFGLYPGHSPFFTMMPPCVLTYEIDSKVSQVVIGEGFLNVADNKVMALVTKAVLPTEINKKEYQETYNSIKEELDSGKVDETRLDQKEKDLEFYRLALEVIDKYAI